MLDGIIKDWKSRNGVVFILHTLKELLDNDFDGKLVATNRRESSGKISIKQKPFKLSGLQVIEESKVNSSLRDSSDTMQEEFKKYEIKPKSSSQLQSVGLQSSKDVTKKLVPDQKSASVDKEGG